MTTTCCGLDCALLEGDIDDERDILIATHPIQFSAMTLQLDVLVIYFR